MLWMVHDDDDYFAYQRLLVMTLALVLPPGLLLVPDASFASALL
jgi:hypothetical protein